MPSFDMVSKLNMGEMKNALLQAQKEIETRYDFKGSDTTIEMKGEDTIEICGEDEYKVKTSLDILYTKMGKRGLGLKGIEPGDIVASGFKRMRQTVKIKMGIDKEQAKIINKLIKDSGLKVTTAYMDEKIRVTGKKIDDLQAAFQLARSNKEVIIELQMENMKS